MAYELTGTLHKVFDTETKGNDFKSRDFIVKTKGEYPQLIKFQVVQDKTAALDNAQPGSTITVSFDLRGREWNEKYFTTLNAWKIAIGQPQLATSLEPEMPF